MLETKSKIEACGGVCFVADKFLQSGWDHVVGGRMSN
jgi:hypothetical protein